MGDAKTGIYQRIWEWVMRKRGFTNSELQTIADNAPQSALTTTLTGITNSAPGTPDYAIQDLTSTTPFGFVTQDEGQTVLDVIANLQTRVDELETALQTLGVLS